MMESNFRQLQRQVDAALRCGTCGKKTAVANVAGYRQPFRGEPVSLESHCSCTPGAPARQLLEADKRANPQDYCLHPECFVRTRRRLPGNMWDLSDCPVHAQDGVALTKAREVGQHAG